MRQRIFRELTSAVSQNEAARKLSLNPKTIDRYLPILANLARVKNNSTLNKSTVQSIEFDEMETFEHTKCKPISIFIAVEDKKRTILLLKACSMPAKGRLSKIALKKYGPRLDERKETLRQSLRKLSVNQNIELLKSDQCPRYPVAVRDFFPDAAHLRFKGRRGCVVGQGELKRGGWDPIFTLNQTAAMIRDFTKRLTRRTWCTTKRIDRLQDLLDIYQFNFNQRLKGQVLPRLG